jgi:hypothetical protein
MKPRECDGKHILNVGKRFRLLGLPLKVDAWLGSHWNAVSQTTSSRRALDREWKKTDISAAPSWMLNNRALVAAVRASRPLP